MDKTAMESIDKLFNCMKEFYGDRWSSQFDRWLPEPVLKTQWQSALHGLNYDEIRGVLVLLRQAAKNPTAMPPHHLEFYHFAKGTARPYINNSKFPDERGDPEVARRALDEINQKLRYKKIAGCST
jgi:hypothetical protein